MSCDKDEPISEGPKKRIKSIFIKDCNIVKDEQGNIMPPVDYHIYLEYDVQNRLTKYTEEYPGYSDDSLEIPLPYLLETSLTYSPGEVSMEIDGRVLGKYTLNSLGYAVKFERGTTKPCTYEYNADGYLIKSDDGETPNTYEYKNGNLVSWNWGNTTGTFKVSKAKDKMNGPAYYQPLRLFIRGNSEVLPAYMAGLFGKTPRYLPESGERVFTLGEKTISSSTVTITYEFDEDGFVTRQTENHLPGGIQGDMYFEYEEVLTE